MAGSIFGLGLGFGTGIAEAINPSSGVISSQSEPLKQFAKVFFPKNKLDEIFHEDQVITYWHESNKGIRESKSLSAWHTTA